MKPSPSLFTETVARPLADRLRPQKPADVVGQDHLLVRDAPLAIFHPARDSVMTVMVGG